MEEKRLNIGLFCDSFFPMQDGVVYVIDNYARRMSEYANVTVFVPKSRDKKYVDNFPYKVVRCSTSFKTIGLDYDLPLPEMDAKFLKEVKESNLDIVHIHSPFSIGKVGVKYAKTHKIPCVATCHSQFKKDFYEATKSTFMTSILMNSIMPVFEKCDECWAVNKEVAKLYFDDYKLSQKPKVKNNGTEMMHYDNIDEVEKLRKFHKIKDDEKVLLFVGRIHILKNIFFIAESLKHLKEKNFKFKMIFVGTGPDLDELKSKIKKYKIEDKIIFAGKVMDRELLCKYYSLADLFIFPSLYDCSSLVQIEAAAQKTPTLFLKHAVTSGTCTEGVDAYFSENNPEKYADKIIEIFNNEEEYEKISEGAFNNLYVLWDDAVKNIYNDYLEVIKKHKEGYYKKLKQYLKNKKVAKKKVAKTKIAKEKEVKKQIKQQKTLEQKKNKQNEKETKLLTKNSKTKTKKVNSNKVK